MNDFSWEDMVLGRSASFEATVTETMMARFRADTGDDNPLHVDGEHARRLGFSDRVVYGLLTASFYSTLAGVHLPGRFCLLMGLDVGFNHPVYVGDRLRVQGEVSHRNEAFKLATLKCTIHNQRGEKVSMARLRVGIRAPEARP